MADYQIMWWDQVPYGVRAFEEKKRVSRQLPMKFMKVIGVLCMVTGRTSQSDFQKGFIWGPRQCREGTAELVAQQVHDELVASYPPSRLVQIVRECKAAHQGDEPLDRSANEPIHNS